MKKYIALISVICCLLLTGCDLKDKLQENSNKPQNLYCTKDISTNGISMIQSAEIKFINDKIDGLGSTILVTLPNEYKSYMSTFIDSFKESYAKQYEGNNHVKVTTSQKSDSEILIDIVFDYKNMTLDEKKNAGFVGSEDYETNKVSLEKSGYSCK